MKIAALIITPRNLSAKKTTRGICLPEGTEMDDFRISIDTVGSRLSQHSLNRFKMFADDLAGIVEGKKFEQLREAGKISGEGEEKW